MKLSSCGISIVRNGLMCLLISSIPLCQAPLCRAESAAHFAKHARKVKAKLGKYRADTYLRLVFRDHTHATGTVGKLAATTFTFTSANSNETYAYRYADVAQVKKSVTWVGEGSLPRHRSRYFLPAIGGAVAAGAAAAILELR